MNTNLDLVNQQNELMYQNQSSNIIEQFLNREIAEKTKVDYIYDIKQFFNVDSISDITVDDIVNVRPLDAENYKNKLLSTYARNSVQTKITRLKAIYEYIYNKCIDNRSGIRLLVGNPFKSIEVRMKEKSTYGSYTREEVCKLIEVAMPEYRVLYELAVRTGCRKEALLKITLDDIRQIDGYWCVCIDWDKTKGNIKEAIPNELYKKMINISKNGKVFNMSPNTVNNVLKRDCIRIGISEDEINDRRLVFHSFKDTCANLTLDVVGKDSDDINSVRTLKNKLKHSNVSTSLKHYDKAEYSPADEVSLKFNLGQYDCNKDLESKLRNMDRLELINLIMGLDENTKKRMLEKLI